MPADVIIWFFPFEGWVACCSLHVRFALLDERFGELGSLAPMVAIWQGEEGAEDWFEKLGNETQEGHSYDNVLAEGAVGFEVDRIAAQRQAHEHPVRDTGNYCHHVAYHGNVSPLGG